ncbi:MAG: HpcH/HpaI aldolase/citrate lyase family protein [Thermodesulfobacteriota bacterium]
MQTKIRRSSLILPVNVQRFVEKAYLRGADAIVLDLEDSVPLKEKDNARQKIKPSLPLAARGGADVFVRVNKEPSLLKEDLQASIYPGLDGLVFPKTETAEEVGNLVYEIEKLEKERGLPEGEIELALLVESPRGLLNLQKIATASPRIRSISIGPEDYCLELGIEPSPEGLELYYAMSKLVVICKANGLMPMGVMGSIGDFRDLKGFEQAARRARQIGCEGASCIHPDQVEILNRVFSPDPARVAYARRVVEAFEEGLAQGTASVNVDGKMVDIPVYNRAKLILQRAEAIAELERKKDNALALLK